MKKSVPIPLLTVVTLTLVGGMHAACADPPKPSTEFSEARRLVVKRKVRSGNVEKQTIWAGKITVNANYVR